MLNLICYIFLTYWIYLKNMELKILYASSSSVYGDKKKYPVNENEIINPKNIYSLSKKNNEEIASIYHKQYGLSSVGLRFFTVYGEWGRPDMLMIKYMLAKLNNIKFILNNKGKHYRDFTYIDDVVFVLKKLILKKIKGHEIYNVCSNKPIKVSKVLNKLDILYGQPKISHKGKLSIEVLKTHGSNLKIKKIINIKKIYWFRSRHVKFSHLGETIFKKNLIFIWRLKKKVFYWAPCLNKVGTVISTKNSAIALAKYKNNLMRFI